MAASFLYQLIDKIRRPGETDNKLWSRLGLSSASVLAGWKKGGSADAKTVRLMLETLKETSPVIQGLRLNI